MINNKEIITLINEDVYHFSDKYNVTIKQIIGVSKTGSYSARFILTYSDEIRELSYAFKDINIMEDIINATGVCSKDNSYSSCNMEDLRAYLNLTYHRNSSAYSVHIHNK